MPRRVGRKSGASQTIVKRSIGCLVIVVLTPAPDESSPGAER